MSKNESECKAAFCKDIRETGGFARRIEDQFAVGVPDVIAVPRGGPVFLIEAKIIRSRKWGATPRQEIELGRFRDAIGNSGAGYACELGFDVESKKMTIRRFGADPSFDAVFKFWNSMGAEKFLKAAHDFWRTHDGN